MKRFILLLTAAMLLTAGSLLIVRAAKAQSVPMTEVHIQRIRSNCIDAQSTLNQLHKSDGLLRVNRGQLYESISTKLMAPLNSRITLNKLDGATLVSVTATYENQLEDFRLKYQSYEEAMSRTLKLNCQNQPVAFYDSVGETREKRKLVHDSTVVLQTTIQKYKDEFEVFAKTVQEKTQ